MRRFALVLCLLPLACSDKDASPPPAVVSSGPVALEAKVRLAIVASDDPIVQGLADAIRADETAREAGILVDDQGIKGRSKPALASFVGEAFARDPRLKPPPDRELVYQEWRPRAEPAYWQLHLIDTSKEMTVENVLGVEVVMDERPRLALKLNVEDGKRFGELTGNNVGRKMVIMVSGRVMSDPVIYERISGGSLSIYAGEWQGSPVKAIERLKDELIGG